jgi:hypothetical protein
MYPVLAAIESLPMVESASYGIEMPFEFVGGGTCCWGQPTATLEAVDVVREGQRTDLHPVTENFFETLGTRLVAGGGWTAADARVGELPVVLGESLAIAHFGSAAAAVGKELQFNGGRVRVVGVAESTAHYGLDQTRRQAMYLPIEALPFNDDRVTFAIKARESGRESGAEIVEAIRTAIWSEEPTLPIPNVERLQAWIDDSAGVRRLGSALSAAFGAIALLLAAGGLYGTLLFAASQRRRELGIRIALGAGRGRIQGDVLASGVGLALIGLGIGVPVALYLGRLLDDFLWNVSPSDPAALIGAALVLVVTAAAASWLPAYRASRTDPVEVLKSD